jgi:predicted nucleotidyltransferase
MLTLDNKTLTRKRREYRKLLHYSANEIVAKLSRLSVEKISLFGSYTRGKADLFTDLDVLVIIDTDKPFIERIAEIHSLLALPVDADILCYTPEEFRRMKDTPFFKKVLADEVVLYEKRPD